MNDLEIEETILQVLKGNPDYTENVWKRVLERIPKLRRERFFHIRDRLVKEQIIFEIKPPHRNKVFLYFLEDSQLLFTKHHINIPDTTEKQALRINHADHIKKDVITPWLSELPKDDICDRILLYDERFKEELKVEKEILFLDFQSHHIKFDDPFNKWNKFKETAKILREQKEKAIDLISCEIIKILGKNISKNNKKAPHWMVEEIFPLVYACVEKNSCPLFDEYRLSVKQDDHNNCICRIEPSMDQAAKMGKRLPIESISSEYKKTFYEISLNRSVNEGSLKKKVDNLPGILLKQAEIKAAVTELLSRKDEMSHLLKDLRISLEKHNKLTVFPGDCEYI